MCPLPLLVDLHRRSQRQGPGGVAETHRAMDLAGLDPATPLKIADIGCGTGASTLALARSLQATITAIDFLADFIAVLTQNAEREGLSHKIDPRVADMKDLHFDEIYDVIWSEGAIYNIGFNQGVRTWKRFLKPGGLLVVSEITWTTAIRPEAIQTYWQQEYGEIDTVSSKIRVLENHGYAPLAHFILPEHCWLDNYYGPMQQEFANFLARHRHSPQAQAIVEAEKYEISLYEKYKAYYSYGMYIARKIAD